MREREEEHFKEVNILFSNFLKGEQFGSKKENEKSFYSLILLEQRFPLKIFLAKYVRILVKSVQLGYSSGNLSESFRIYQRLEASKQKIQGIVSVLQRNSGTPKASKYFVTRDICKFRIPYLLC